MSSVQKNVLIPYDRYQQLIKRSTKYQIQSGQGQRLEERSIVDAIPTDQTHRAQEILRLIRDSPEQPLNWNENGEIIYRGTLKRGSSITKLLRHLVSGSKTTKPIGQREFLESLKEMGVTVSLITQSIPRPPGKRNWMTL